MSAPIETPERDARPRGHVGEPAYTPGAPRRKRGVTRILVGAGLLFAALLAVGTLPRLQRQRDLNAEVRSRTEALTVRVLPVHRGPASFELTLPGTAQAMRETPIYARSTGFVRRWLVDIGARVRAGQLLAELETPEVDQELAQARASLARARSSETLAKATLDRMPSLVRDSAASRQELDEKQAAFDAAAASVAAEEANVRRLGELQGFARVTAPFSGVITERNLEQGGLVSAGTSGGSAKPLFVIAQADTVRVFVNVPENAATAVKAGLTATVTVRDRPGREMRGRVSRTSGALDPATRTMVAQVDVPNVGNALLPGMYAEVKLATTRAVPAILIPANALVVRSAGPQVATVHDGTIHFTTLQLGRDLGTELEVISGVSDGEQVVINPSDDVVEGAKVRTVAADGDAGKKKGK
jgi:RND family efflux transporter MFP subunit